MGLGEGGVTAENAVGSPGKVGGKPYFGGKNQMKNKVRFFMWGTGRRKIQDVAVAPRRRRVSRNGYRLAGHFRDNSRASQEACV